MKRKKHEKGSHMYSVHNRFHFMKWLVWILAVLFLFYEFFLRVYPSIMTRELMKTFQVDALVLGTLSAFYFYSYAPMQLPVGMLMDRYGARKLLTFAALVCGIGCFLFAGANTLFTAEAGRFLMGIGSAFAFVGMVFVSSHWFSGTRLALLVGIGNSIGLLGAAFGEGPLSIVVDTIGWRETVYILATFGIALGVVIFMFIRTEQADVSNKVQHTHSLADAFSSFQSVCMNYNTWFNAIGALLFFLTTNALAGLWAVPFLQAVHGLSNEVAAFAVTMLFIGEIVGGPLVGIISDRMKRRKPLLYISCIGAFVCIMPLIYISPLSPTPIFILFFLIGLFSAAELLNFPLAVELNNEEAKGSSIAITNFVIAIGGSIMQPVVGYLLDLSAGTISLGHSTLYTAANYKYALIVFPVSLLLALFFFLPIQEHTSRLGKTSDD